jgi:hypothetical protein
LIESPSLAASSWYGVLEFDIRERHKVMSVLSTSLHGLARRCLKLRFVHLVVCVGAR